MIDETEVKPQIKTEVPKSEPSDNKPHLNGTSEPHNEFPEITTAPPTPPCLTDEEQIQQELTKLTKLSEFEATNSSEVFCSRRSALKQAKAKKLKQLQIDLKNEEAKLILLKRLYYSQRIASQPLTQQQQLLKQQQLQQQQKNQQMKKANALNNAAAMNNGGMQRQSIMNNKVWFVQMNFK